MKTFRTAYPLYCFNERCYQSVFSLGQEAANASGETELAMKLYCPSCKNVLLSALDIELENMAIGGGLSLSEEILVSETPSKRGRSAVFGTITRPLK